jgi:uncharacterized protein
MSSREKYDLLVQWFEKSGQTAVAFSGGVDSTFLLALAKKVLGDKVLALTIHTPYLPEREISETVAFCRSNHISHRIISTGIIPAIMHNPENRCYLCKHHLFSLIKAEAHILGFHHVIDGTNSDDSGVYRPGLAALRELDIKSPLLDHGISKSDVRKYSADMGLSTAQKPSYACLLTRLPYNYAVKSEELIRVEKAELYMSSIGYANSRVRNHDETARIEMEKERIAEFVHSGDMAGVISCFHILGYKYITVDLEGYRSGSFDKALKQTTR